MTVKCDDHYDHYVITRLFDFFGSRTAWHRRLWNVGLVLGIREVLEGSEALQSGVLSQKAFEDLCVSVESSAGNDPGVGSPEQHGLLQKILRSFPRLGSANYHILKQLLEDINHNYLKRWLTLPNAGNRTSPERTAKSIAAHLLDAGFSSIYLYGWWLFKTKNEERSPKLIDLIEEAHLLVESPSKNYEVLVAFVKAPRSRRSMPPEWRDAPAVSVWLKHNNFVSSGLRQGGGMVLGLSARDPLEAVDQALEIVEKLRARISIGARSDLRIHDHAWIKGESKSYSLQRPRRGVDVTALDRENQLYIQSGTANVDAALELIAPLDTGPPAPAVSGGWAALETLLLGPGDSGDRGVAGDRLASLIACSFPRAELTSLAYGHQRNCDDSLAANLRAAADNRSRAKLVASAILTGAPLALKNLSDKLGEERVRLLLKEPRLVLRDVEKYLRQAFRRFYRQRNLVLHWGRVNAVCLKAALRTTAPLIGAGLDRIIHAYFVENISPLELSSRARLRLELIETSQAIQAIDLLEKGK